MYRNIYRWVDTRHYVFYIITSRCAQLLVGRVEVHRLQCKNCQYRFLGQYPSKMNDFFSWPPFTKWDDYHPTPARPDPFNWSKTHSTGPKITVKVISTDFSGNIHRK